MSSAVQQNTLYKKHTLSLFVANKPGVLIRISLVFSRRGYNIESLVVSPSNNPEYSTMNITASGDDKVLDQIIKQLAKLVDVVHVSDRTGEDVIQRELALIKLHCDAQQRSNVLQLAHALKCDTVDVSEETITFELTGTSEDLDNAGRVFDAYGVQEVMRTGKVLMARGNTLTA
ncbi:MAG: acetolactate synthase small subunit [Spirochaetales bacterium]|nr:acetolactate synthase small subunit [Spirochaetales bacterium]MCF7938313.1 acetolactate synthase small subunit [Spirochaetales bacterium]